MVSNRLLVRHSLPTVSEALLVSEKEFKAHFSLRAEATEPQIHRMSQ